MNNTTGLPLERLPNVPDVLQERLENAMEAYDQARGVYLAALADLYAADVNWEDIVDRTGCSREQIDNDLDDWLRIRLLQPPTTRDT